MIIYKYVLGLGTKVQTLVHLLCIQNLISSFEDSLHVHFNACTCTLRAAKRSECSIFICWLRIQISILPLKLPATPTFMFAQAHLYTQMCG